MLSPPPGSRGGAGPACRRLSESTGPEPRGGADPGCSCQPRGPALRGAHLLSGRPSHRACREPLGQADLASGQHFTTFWRGHCPGPAGALADRLLLTLRTDGSLRAGAFHSPRTSRPPHPPLGCCPQPAGFVGGRQGADGTAVSRQETAGLGPPAPAPTLGPPLL